MLWKNEEYLDKIEIIIWIENIIIQNYNFQNLRNLEPNKIQLLELVYVKFVKYFLKINFHCFWTSPNNISGYF